MVRQLPTRQRLRKALIILTFLSFPLTMNFFSPYVSIDGSAVGLVSGSLVMFGLMFLSSLFLGRLWCGWVCPGGGLQEMIEPVNMRPVSAKTNWIKWLIWVPWITLIVFLFVQAGGIHSLDLLRHTEGGISVSGTAERPIFIAYIIYFAVIGLFLLLSWLVGRRAGCHTFCWMAPFMMIGRWLRNRFHWPALGLAATPATCIDCGKCTTGCPMSLEVNSMVKSDHMENSECILCGTCVDTCPKKTIRYSFGKK